MKPNQPDRIDCGTVKYSWWNSLCDWAHRLCACGECDQEIGTGKWCPSCDEYRASRQTKEFHKYEIAIVGLGSVVFIIVGLWFRYGGAR